MTTPSLVSHARRLSLIAADRPDEVAAVIVAADGSERELRWSELDAAARRCASLLAARGVGETSTVVVGIPRCTEHLIATFAAWRLGACVAPVRDDLPVAERTGLLELTAPDAVVAEWPEVSGALSRSDVWALDQPPAPADADVVPDPAVAVASGGSTGRPKLILTNTFKGGVAPDTPANPLGALFGMRSGQVTLITSPLYASLGFGVMYLSLLDGSRAILIEKFDPELVLDLIERHSVQFLTLVPTMMQRLLRVPGIEKRDLSSVETLVHSAAMCPAWVKRGWIELLGPTRLLEMYASTEGSGLTLVTGQEWLDRPETVGRGVLTEIRILGEDGVELPTGEVGEIFMRMGGLTDPLYQYKGAERGPITADGFASVGDLGWVDADGYLFIADRRTDMIITGGSNVFPAEVEAVLSEHPAVADVVVVGKADEEWGKRVHAIVQPSADGTPASADELIQWCRERLAAYKVPKAVEFVDRLPRNEAGKINRTALAR